MARPQCGLTSRMAFPLANGRRRTFEAPAGHNANHQPRCPEEGARPFGAIVPLNALKFPGMSKPIPAIRPLRILDS